jgi:hypothetical protein
MSALSIVIYLTLAFSVLMMIASILKAWLVGVILDQVIDRIKEEIKHVKEI